MTDTRDTGTNLVNTILGLKKFDGSNPADFKAGMIFLCVVIGVTRRDILPLLKGEEKPTDTIKISTPCCTFSSSYLQPSVSRSMRMKARSAATDKQPSRISAATTTRSPMRSSAQPWKSS